MGQRPVAAKERALQIGAPVLIAVVAHAATLVVAYFALRLAPGRTWIHALGSWDAGYYLRIAEGGYPAEFSPDRVSVHGFFPLYPLLTRVVMTVTGLSALRAGVLLNVLLATAALVAIWLLVERLSDAESATRAVLLLAFFPWAFVFTMTYAEPLLLLCAAITLLALLDRRWLVAGVASAAAGAARPNGLALGLCCAWAAFEAVRDRREWRALVAPALAPLGLLAFFTYMHVRTGDFFANIHLKDRALGDQGIGLDPASAMPRIRGLFDAPLNDLNFVASVLCLVLLVFGLHAMWRWRPPLILWLYVGPVLLLAVVYTTYGSMPRFVLTAFPVVAALAVRRRNEAVFGAMVGASAMVMAAVYATVITSITFTP